MTSAIAEQPDVQAAIELFRAWVQARIAYWSVPGVSIAVVHDQALVWAKGFGHADVERKVPATADTLYRVGSITKLFTATALLQLRDAGALRLDDPVAAHLPWFSIERGGGHGAVLTLRHLLTHTSGLPREAAFPYWDDFRFPSTEELRDGLGRQRTLLEAETRWKYSNLAFALAGEVVAAVAGLPYPEYVEQRILRPLGMSSTLVGSPKPDDARVARGYGRRLPREPRKARAASDLGALTPAGGITSSASDLARFAMLQFRTDAAAGAPVLAGRTLREMQRIHWLEPSWQAGWGLGFRVVRDQERTCVGHGGLLAGYAAELRLVPEDKVGIVVLSNAEDASPLLYAERATRWLVPAIAAAVRPPAPARALDPALRRYLGRYRGEWADVQVIAGREGLQVIAPFALDPAVGAVQLTPAGEHTFVMDSPDGFGSPGELVRFELDARGAVARVRFGESSLYPVEDW